MNCAQAGWRTSSVTAFSTSRESLAADGVAQQHLGAEVVPRRIEFEGAARADTAAATAALSLRRIAGVDADAGQDARQLLHVLLRVAAIDAQRVQLHQLARVVLIDVAGGILGVVQVLQHRRMLERRQHQVAEMPERMRADRVLLVVADQPAQIGLVLMHAEMIEPEPHHLLLQLRG